MRYGAESNEALRATLMLGPANVVRERIALRMNKLFKPSGELKASIVQAAQ